ncbi:hypothetical protein GALMADRAFT_144850 [Galerina marginata CBS 339.88]|uniref:Uncharacterized protein n=1 Tax=Galerina marginata (strain CBS 339.88) TaxID=685588 RepID=A0A067SJH2_GALM3|nr:hypothetical protein GALMADRAFT_144850 [Galerina marginata CBS 339.88]
MIRPFINRMFQPLLDLAGIPVPLFPDPEAFATAAFPPRELPLSVGDWRDVIVYLVSSPISHDSLAKTKTMGTRRQPQEMHKVVEVGRYTFVKAGEAEHQVVVVKVEVGAGLYKLLRIERARGVSDFESDCDAAIAKIRPDSELVEVSTQDPSAPPRAIGEQKALPLGPVLGSRSVSAASDAIQQIRRTPVPEPAPSPGPISPTSPHPSLSIYNVDALGLVKHDVPVISPARRRLANLSWIPFRAHDDKEKIGSCSQTNSDIDLDTVQTIFEADLRTLVLMESVQPRDFYLHHLALLVGEVHDYNPRHPKPEPVITGPHHCTLFAELIMCVLAKEMDVLPMASDPRHREEVINNIASSYRAVKDDVGRRIAKAVGGAGLAEDQKQPEAQDDSRTRPSTAKESDIQIKREDVAEPEHIEVADVHV